jgi:hypothetical protein
MPDKIYAIDTLDGQVYDRLHGRLANPVDMLEEIDRLKELNNRLYDTFDKVYTNLTLHFDGGRRSDSSVPAKDHICGCPDCPSSNQNRKPTTTRLR